MNIRRVTRWVQIVVFCWFAVMGALSPAWGGETLARIKAMGMLRCGVSEGIPGFSEKDAAGNWKGFDVDFCRAVAAAALGDSKKVRFVPLRAAERFPALKGGLVDLLMRNTTWTLGREAGLKVKFPGILFYDGQGFMVPIDSPTADAKDLQGKTICLVKGTTHAENLADYFSARGWHYSQVQVDSYGDGLSQVLEGRCQALTGDVSALAAQHLGFPGAREKLRLLPDQISKEPLAPVVRGDDGEWVTLVRWVLFLLINAEENGITRDNVQQLVVDNPTPAVARSMDACRVFAKPMGIPPDWAVRVTAQVGNYGEIFDRNLGTKSPYDLERGLNRLWKQGGLLYAPPMR
ncbi:MAG: amino acid ABC transporter substrate-binding protein [Thermodesulfobacteriota bacterium]